MDNNYQRQVLTDMIAFSTNHMFDKDIIVSDLQEYLEPMQTYFDFQDFVTGTASKIKNSEEVSKHLLETNKDTVALFYGTENLSYERGLREYEDTADIIAGTWVSKVELAINQGKYAKADYLIRNYYLYFYSMYTTTELEYILAQF